MRSCSFLNRRRQEFCTECGADLTLCVCEDPDEAAHQRLNSSEGQFIRAVGAALDAPGINDHLYESLVEKVGDLGAALVDHNQTRSPAPDEIYRILVEIATFATRIATEGTPEYAYPTN